MKNINKLFDDMSVNETGLVAPKTFPHSTAIRWVHDNRRENLSKKLQDGTELKDPAQTKDILQQPEIPLPTQSDLRQSALRNPKLYNPSYNIPRTPPNLMNKALNNRVLPPIVIENMESKGSYRMKKDNVDITTVDNLVNILKETSKSAQPETIYDSQTHIPQQTKTTAPQEENVFIKAKKLVDKLNNETASVMNSGTKIVSSTLEMLNKSGNKKPRCAQCGWKKVDVVGQFCEACQSEYL